MRIVVAVQSSVNGGKVCGTTTVMVKFVLTPGASVSVKRAVFASRMTQVPRGGLQVPGTIIVPSGKSIVISTLRVCEPSLNEKNGTTWGTS
jgi:hypothetical protein